MGYSKQKEAMSFADALRATMKFSVLRCPCGGCGWCGINPDDPDDMYDAFGRLSERQQGMVSRLIGHQPVRGEK